MVDWRRDGDAVGIVGNVLLGLLLAQLLHEDGLGENDLADLAGHVGRLAGRVLKLFGDLVTVHAVALGAGAGLGARARAKTVGKGGKGGATALGRVGGLSLGQRDGGRERMGLVVAAALGGLLLGELDGGVGGVLD